MITKIKTKMIVDYQKTSKFEICRALLIGLTIGIVVDPLVVCAELGRVKREGFGPWEEDETLKTVERMVEKLIEAEQKLVNKTEEILIEFEKETVSFFTSKGRIIIWVAAGLAALAMIRLCWPLLVAIIELIFKMVRGIFFLLRATTCCMHCCALKPFVIARNKFRDYRKNKRHQNVDVGAAESLVSEGSRTTAEIEFDQYGPHVRGTFGEKIYFSRSQLDVNSYLALASAPPSTGFSEGRVKETVLAKSQPRIIKSLPAFQGYFTVDGHVVGHCARVAVGKKSALITAYHVLSYNRKADLFLNANGKSVRFSDIQVTPMFFSSESNLDYVVLSVPEVIFAKLAMKQAKMANHITYGSPVHINQIIDGQTCYTVGLVQKDDRPWMLKYGATTTEGTSGAPILNTRGEFVGVHIEGGKTANVGVVVEILRRRKESAQNGDLFAEDPESQEAELENRIEAGLDDEENMTSRVFQFATNYIETHEGQSWTDMMDDLDDAVEERFFGDSEDHEGKKGKVRDNYKAYILAAGKHINQRIKGDRFRKESPWTCSRCMALHLKRGYKCVNCGYALKRGETMKDSVKEVISDKVEAVKSVGFPTPVEDKILACFEDLSVRMQNLEWIVKHKVKETATKVTDDEMKKRAKLPSKAHISAALAMPLLTSVGAQSDNYLHGNLLVPGDSGLYKKPAPSAPLQETPVKVVDSPIKVETIRKTEVTAPLEEFKKKRRRGRRNGGKKEVTVKETSQVPLNSKSPSGDGVTTTSGVSPKPSQSAQKSSVVPNAPSTQQSNPKRVSFGAQPKPSSRV